MKRKEFKKLSEEKIATLNQVLQEKQEKKLKALLELKTGQLKNVKEPWRLRREISQIKTLIREKELKEEA